MGESTLMMKIDLRSAWTALPLVGKLFFLFLAAVTAKSVYTSARVLIATRTLSRGNARSLRPYSVPKLGHTLSFLRQLHMFTFFVFGFCISLMALDGYGSVVCSNLTGAAYVLDHFRYCLVWSACVSCALLGLHCLQWLASARLHSTERKLEI